MAAAGIFGALKKKKPILMWFAMVMALMFVVTVAQLTFTMIALSDCNNEDSFFHFMCSNNEILYFAHSFAIIAICLAGFVISLMLRWRIKKTGRRSRQLLLSRILRVSYKIGFPTMCAIF